MFIKQFISSICILHHTDVHVDFRISTKKHRKIDFILQKLLSILVINTLPKQDDIRTCHFFQKNQKWWWTIIMRHRAKLPRFNDADWYQISVARDRWSKRNGNREEVVQRHAPRACGPSIMLVPATGGHWGRWRPHIIGRIVPVCWSTGHTVIYLVAIERLSTVRPDSS